MTGERNPDVRNGKIIAGVLICGAVIAACTGALNRCSGSTPDDAPNQTTSPRSQASATYDPAAKMPKPQTQPNENGKPIPTKQAQEKVKVFMGNAGLGVIGLDSASFYPDDDAALQHFLALAESRAGDPSDKGKVEMDCSVFAGVTRAREFVSAGTLGAIEQSLEVGDLHKAVIDCRTAIGEATLFGTTALHGPKIS